MALIGEDVAERALEHAFAKALDLLTPRRGIRSAPRRGVDYGE